MYIPTYIYILKSCQQHCYGFGNLMSSWGSYLKISKSPFVGDFSFFGLKVGFFLQIPIRKTKKSADQLEGLLEGLSPGGSLLAAPKVIP